VLGDLLVFVLMFMRVFTVLMLYLPSSYDCISNMESKEWEEEEDEQVKQKIEVKIKTE